MVYSQGLDVFNMQKHFKFVSNFEHVNFTINEKYFKKHYDNLNYYVSLVIFQTYKNVILRCPLTWVAPLIVFLLK
jgi:hypothetical protein